MSYPAKIEAAMRYLEYTSAKEGGCEFIGTPATELSKQEEGVKKAVLTCLLHYFTGEQSFKEKPLIIGEKKKKDVNLEQGECEAKEVGEGDGKESI